MKRLSKRDFPPYKFLPGKQIHPNKPGGYRHGEEEPEVEIPTIETLLDNEDYRYSIDLFNHGYYWEAHVWWEAFWNHFGRKGAEADLFKGLIKLAAGGVKMGIDQSIPAKGHLERASELLSGCLPLLGGQFLISPEKDLKSLLNEIQTTDLNQNFIQL